MIGKPCCRYADGSETSRKAEYCTRRVTTVMGSASAKDSCSSRVAALGCVLRSTVSTIICTHNMTCLALAGIAARLPSILFSR